MYEINSNIHLRNHRPYSCGLHEETTKSLRYFSIMSFTALASYGSFSLHPKHLEPRTASSLQPQTVLVSTLRQPSTRYNILMITVYRTSLLTAQEHKSQFHETRYEVEIRLAFFVGGACIGALTAHLCLQGKRNSYLSIHLIPFAPLLELPAV